MHLKSDLEIEPDRRSIALTTGSSALTSYNKSVSSRDGILNVYDQRPLSTPIGRDLDTIRTGTDQTAVNKPDLQVGHDVGRGSGEDREGNQHRTGGVGAIEAADLDSTPTASEDDDPGDGAEAANQAQGAKVSRKEKIWAYLRTPQFWIVLTLSQTLALCITAMNTFSSLLAQKGISVPAFQNWINYELLNLVFTSITIYRYGPKKWAKMVLKDGWKYFIFAFIDVQANYFIVLAYRYTTILSIELLTFTAIITVVALSFFFLKVRYRPTQIIGILICCSGMGVLIASDHLRGAGNSPAPEPNAIKGDLFALLAATLYGMTNTYEEFALSRSPVYEVLGQLAFWASIISGVQAAIFDRKAIARATWTGSAMGYLAGYTLCLFLFYCLAPILFRLASAAVVNIGNLTANFWGVLIGTRVFGLTIHWMYPPAFVLMVVGLVVYFLAARDGVFADSYKPWLGPEQEGGISGIGTARRRVENPDALV